MTGMTTKHALNCWVHSADSLSVVIWDETTSVVWWHCVKWLHRSLDFWQRWDTRLNCLAYHSLGINSTTALRSWDRWHRCATSAGFSLTGVAECDTELRTKDLRPVVNGLMTQVYASDSHQRHNIIQTELESEIMANHQHPPSVGYSTALSGVPVLSLNCPTQRQRSNCLYPGTVFRGAPRVLVEAHTGQLIGQTPFCTEFSTISLICAIINRR